MRSWEYNNFFVRQRCDKLRVRTRTILSQKVKYHYDITCILPADYHRYFNPSNRSMMHVTQHFFSVLSLAPQKTRTYIRICDKVSRFLILSCMAFFLEDFAFLSSKQFLSRPTTGYLDVNCCCCSCCILVFVYS